MNVANEDSNSLIFKNKKSQAQLTALTAVIASSLSTSFLSFLIQELKMFHAVYRSEPFHIN